MQLMWTLPNLVTVTRIVLLPFFIWRILQQDFIGALILFLLAGISDGLDGWLARRLGQFSELGERLDPLADKLLLVSSFVVLTIPGQGFTPIPLWLTAIVLLRDVAILCAAVIIQLTTKFRHFRPSYYGKLSTTIQIITILLFLTHQVFSAQPRWLLDVAYVATIGMTIFSGLHYIVHVRMLMADYRKEQA